FDCNRDRRAYWRVGYVVLRAIDDPLATSRLCGDGLERYVGRCRAMIVHAKPRVCLSFMVGEGEMEVAVVDEFQQEAFALGVIHHVVKQKMTKPRGRREGGGNVGIAGRQFFGHDAAGEMIRASAATVF